MVTSNGLSCHSQTSGDFAERYKNYLFGIMHLADRYANEYVLSSLNCIIDTVKSLAIVLHNVGCSCQSLRISNIVIKLLFILLVLSPTMVDIK